MSQIRELFKKDKADFNKLAGHVIQSWEWGDFREKTGIDVVRLGHFEGSKLKLAYQFTLHPIPFFGFKVGYLPKGPMPTKGMVQALVKIGGEKKVAFFKIEPNVEVSRKPEADREKLLKLGLVKSKKSLFTKYNFVLDLTKSEETLLANMHQKTRYNIKVAQKKGVEVYESTKDSDFEIYLKLYFETTRRQKYFGHTPHYHRLVWETLKNSKMARVLIAKYKNKPLVAWMLLSFGETLYYPYGGSSLEHKDVMASNLVAWKAIKLGKKLGLKKFDMWGALSPEPDQSDPWFGFHRFKAGYGGRHVEYVGTYDLVLNQALYGMFNAADKLRWILLRAARR